MVFSRSSPFKTVKPPCEQRKHDIQTIPTHSGEMLDDTEALQGAVVQNENLRGYWVLTELSSLWQEYWAMWAYPQYRAWLLSHRCGDGGWVEIQALSSWILLTIKLWVSWELADFNREAMSRSADPAGFAHMSQGYLEVSWSGRCYWPCLDLLMCFGVSWCRLIWARLAQSISGSSGNQLRKIGPSCALGSPYPSLLFLPGQQKSPVMSSLGNGRGTREPLHFIKSLPWLLDVHNCLDGLLFSAYEVLILRETKGCLELGYRVRADVRAHFFCFSGSLHQLQSHTIFARICACEKRTLNSSTSPPVCNKVLNLMNRLHITCLHPNKKESWGKEMVLHGEGRISTVKNYDLGERMFRRFWIAMNDGCSVQLPYLCRVTWLFRT